MVFRPSLPLEPDVITMGNRNKCTTQCLSGKPEYCTQVLHRAPGPLSTQPTATRLAWFAQIRGLLVVSSPPPSVYHGIMFVPERDNAIATMAHEKTIVY